MKYLSKAERDLTYGDVKEFYNLISDEKIFALFNLEEREKQILKMRWDERLTFINIAKHLKVTSERARQLYRIAIDKLKQRILLAIQNHVEQSSLITENQNLKEINAVFAKRFESLSNHDKLIIGDVNVLKINVRDALVSKRTLNLFIAADIYTINDLLAYSEKELLNFPSVGKFTINEINYLLNKHGLKLGIKSINE